MVEVKNYFIPISFLLQISIFKDLIPKWEPVVIYFHGQAQLNLIMWKNTWGLSTNRHQTHQINTKFSKLIPADN